MFPIDFVVNSMVMNKMFVPFRPLPNTMDLSVVQEIEQHEFGVHLSMNDDLQECFFSISFLFISFSQNSFEQRALLKDHTNFVIATCYIPANGAFPDGLIATGGNDKKICVYSAKQGTHLFTLEGHTETGE